MEIPTRTAPEEYTSRVAKIKHLPEAIYKRYLRTGLLLPLDYRIPMLDRRHQITASMWRAYSKCQRNYSLRYIEGLQKKGGSMPLHVGTFTHNLITSLLLKSVATNHAIDMISRWEADMLTSRKDLEAEGIFTGWNEGHVHEATLLMRAMVLKWTGDELWPLAASIQGRVPMVTKAGRRHPSLDYGFEFDGLIQDAEFDDLWVWELKTTSLKDQHAYESFIEHDPQAWGYMWAASKIFGRPVGIVYDVLKKKTPKAVHLSYCKKGACKKVKESNEYWKKIFRFGLWKEPTIGTNGTLMKLDDLQNFDFGEDNCPSCGGTGFSKIITGRTKCVEMESLKIAVAILSGRTGYARQSPAAVEQFGSPDFENYVNAVEWENQSLAYKIWRKPTREYLQAFEREILQVGREIRKKVSQSTDPSGTKDARSEIWRCMRGSCRDFTGSSTCDFIPICPDIGGGGEHLYEKRDTSAPVELIDGDTFHQRGIIASNLLDF